MLRFAQSFISGFIKPIKGRAAFTKIDRSRIRTRQAGWGKLCADEQKAVAVVLSRAGNAAQSAAGYDKGNNFYYHSNTKFYSIVYK